MQCKRRQQLVQLWRRHVRPLVFLVLLLSAFRSSIADWNDVPTGSMEPSILPGDRIFVNKLAYDLKVPFTGWRLARWGSPAAGDIVIFSSPRDGTRLVKRVVGVPGDTLELRDNVLWINGTASQYTALGAGIIGQLDPAQQRGRGFARESLGGCQHPVMSTPSLPARRSFGPVTVPAERYFMMGDNRDNSFDSRYFGLVDRDRIVGRAPAVVLSVDLDHCLAPRWKRFFQAIP